MIVITFPDVSNDPLLLQRAKKGSMEAQREIYEQYFSPIYHFIRMRVADREAGKDIAADVFLDLFEALQGKSPPTSNLRAWLFRVARNKLTDYYKRNKKHSTTILEEWYPTAIEDSPEMQAAQAFDFAQVRHAMQRLSDDQQEVLILRFGQVLNLEETADVMGKEINAVKALQFRAIKRLREIFYEVRSETAHE